MLLIKRNAKIIAFAVLLICMHPVVEVLFSIYRRRLKKLDPGRPDWLHLHLLIMRRGVSQLLLVLNDSDRHQMLTMRNPVTGLVLVLMGWPNLFAAVWLGNEPVLAALCCLLFAADYVKLYARLLLRRVNESPSRHRRLLTNSQSRS